MKDNETLVEVLDPRGQPSGIFGRRIEANSNPGAILDPKNQPTNNLNSMEGLQMAERVKTLNDKKIYLVDTGFFGAKEFLEEVQTWFVNNIPGAKTELRTKQGTIFSDDPALWEEIKENADAVVIGVGG
ncbi:MAG: hypothetical protein JW864_11490 [Spirochaetes bacterium]|nr:hypothetical protein [Spirochaetota bacterium]